ncbi:MAG: Cro/CI family transcriptional regulator [Mariprofundaceae bacterium]
MNKKLAIKTFGSGAALARAIGVSKSAVSSWPDELPPRIADRVIAACVRQGIDPAPLLATPPGPSPDGDGCGEMARLIHSPHGYFRLEVDMVPPGNIDRWRRAMKAANLDLFTFVIMAGNALARELESTRREAA